VSRVLRALGEEGLIESLSPALGRGWVIPGGQRRESDADRIKAAPRVEVAALGEGERLAAEHVLASRHGAERAAVNRALRALAEERVVESRGGGRSGGWVSTGRTQDPSPRDAMERDRPEHGPELDLAHAGPTRRAEQTASLTSVLRAHGAAQPAGALPRPGDRESVEDSPSVPRDEVVPTPEADPPEPPPPADLPGA